MQFLLAKVVSSQADYNETNEFEKGSESMMKSQICLLQALPVGGNNVQCWRSRFTCDRIGGNKCERRENLTSTKKICQPSFIINWNKNSTLTEFLIPTFLLENIHLSLFEPKDYQIRLQMSNRGQDLFVIMELWNENSRINTE